MRVFWVVFGALIIPLSACDDGPPPQTPEERAAIVSAAATRLPTDPALAEKYMRSCQSCHADPENASPLSGDTRAWQARLDARGTEGLLQSTLNGFGGMPPLGACPDCSLSDFKALISFMSARQNDKAGDIE